MFNKGAADSASMAPGVNGHPVDLAGTGWEAAADDANQLAVKMGREDLETPTEPGAHLIGTGQLVSDQPVVDVTSMTVPGAGEKAGDGTGILWFRERNPRLRSEKAQSVNPPLNAKSTHC